MSKRALYHFLLAAFVSMLSLSLMAQEDNGEAVRHAERVFAQLRQDVADSLYYQLANDMKKMVAKEQLGGAMKQAEQLMGTYSKHDEWVVNRQDTLTVCSTTCFFENGELSMVVVFDDAWMIHGLRMMPKADQTEDEPLPEGVVELNDTVRTTDGLALPCVVTLSGRSATPPIAVLVHGSGPLDRDETVMANKPFRDLARLLAVRGISTLRYDKRTFVSRQPVASMEEETIDDALAAITLARAYNNNVYVVGHSLGAMLAPAIATRTAVKGIVMMAAPARDLEQVVNDQLELLAGSEEQKKLAMEEMRRQTPHYFKPQQQVQLAQRLDAPILLLQGERDYQVTMLEYRIWQKKLRKKADATLIAYPALNHLFIHGEGASTPQEYMKKGCVSEQVTDDIARFIQTYNK